MPTIAQIHRDVVTTLRAAKIPNPSLEASLLLAHALGKPRTWLVAHGDAPAAARSAARVRRLVMRRAAHMPLAYLIGTAPFAGLEFRVTPAVLIPRPETETLVEHLLADGRSPQRVLDVGTGSGAIACALARAWPHAAVHACDISTAALRIARSNARTLRARVRFHHADLIPRRGRPWGCIVANLPYLTTREMRSLQPEVAQEPSSALDGGRDGAVLVRRLVAMLPTMLAPGGIAALEVHPTTARALVAFAQRILPTAHVRATRDLHGREHFVWIER